MDESGVLGRLHQLDALVLTWRCVIYISVILLACSLGLPAVQLHVRKLVALLT